MSSAVFSILVNGRSPSRTSRNPTTPRESSKATPTPASIQISRVTVASVVSVDCATTTIRGPSGISRCDIMMRQLVAPSLSSTVNGRPSYRATVLELINGSTGPATVTGTDRSNVPSSWNTRIAKSVGSPSDWR